MKEASSPEAQPVGILITGVAGHLGRQLAPLLKDYLLVGVDRVCPTLDHPRVQFCQLDLSEPEAIALLRQLITENNVRIVIHLAFVLDPVRTGVLEENRQREINVGGTENVLQAVEEANREKRQVELFVYLSSVTAYGSDLPHAVSEDVILRGHTLPYAIHKRETDLLCQSAHPRLGGCAVYILRAHIFLGPTIDNFILRAFRGRLSGRSWLAQRINRWGWRLPIVLPSGRRYDGLFQFLHIDDVARLLQWLCSHYQPGKLEVLNVQGKGKPLTHPEGAVLAGARLLRLPSYGLVQLLFRLLWWSGLSGVPPKALPYFAGRYVMDCTRLRRFLGREYDRIIQYTSAEALRSATQQ